MAEGSIMNISKSDGGKNDPLSLRVVLLVHYWNNNKAMYERWARAKWQNKKKLWEEKALMCHEIVSQLNDVLSEIDKKGITYKSA